MSSQKKRIAHPTSLPEVKHYKFELTPERIFFQEVLGRFRNLMLKNEQAGKLRDQMTPEEKRAFQGVLTASEKREIKSLSRYIAEYKEVQRVGMQSILSTSRHEEEIGHGQDNHVFVAPENSLYVHKYSVESYDALPSTVVYLRKKYQMLKVYLGSFIPTSYFVLGERVIPYDKKKVHKQGDVRTAVITMQRRIQGKTFQDPTFTAEEKARPEVVESLARAHMRYVLLKQFLREEAHALGLSEDTMDAKLDIGRLSKVEHGRESFNAELVKQFTSPNVMYDENKKQIFFIDFDMNEWNEDKEKVFTRMMLPDVQHRFEKALASMEASAE